MSTFTASLAAAVAIAAGCGGGDDGVGDEPPAAPARIELTSPAFRANGSIPAQFTCDGEGVSPPLAWSGVPRRAKELALLVEDPDATGGTFVHWAVFRLDPRHTGLRAGEVPREAAQGESSFGDTRYGGPCPPEGDDPHRYWFLLYALSAPLGVPGGADAQTLREAIASKAIARGELVGRFGR